MTDKERLEEIKHDYRNTEFANRFFTSFKNIDWLIEQAERVQKLEVSLNLLGYSLSETVRTSKVKDETIKGIEQQNKCYREALGYYGYECGYIEDDGYRARKALEGDK